MTSRRVILVGAILLAYCGLVALAYAVGAPTKPGCQLGGRDTAVSANGDRASFTVLAVASPPRGVSLFQDDGPTRPVRVRSLSITSLTCDSARRSATLAGMASVNGAGSFPYRVEISLVDPSGGGQDSYRIAIGAYDSGPVRVRPGAFRIGSGG